MSRGAGRMDAWSRRKARVAEAEAAEARRAERAAAEAAAADKSDAELCAALDLPDPDSLAPGDDFAAFLKKEVPERLRRRALRKLWLTNPALANVDGLVDYGEDFTIPERAVGAVIATAYKVGRGIVAPEAEAVEVAQGDIAEGAVEEGPVQEDAGEADTVEVGEPGSTRLADAAPPPPAAASAGPAPRRMRFVFDGARSDPNADQNNDQNREPA